MKFKRMEAFGFKSFADKIDIPLNEGITAIVGPNGCGKSNVADAIRWVLGEQSAKNLRGKSMQDVIFNGTAVRKPLSFCEVALTFDNTTRIFDIELDEVVIGRKLYRSGESVYLINGEPSKLKDIHALIRNTGLGKDGYSIVGQGRVAEIINAKPENRRNIFEDAAGILGFKKEKIEAERSLARTEENLNVIRTAKNSLEGQRNTLEKQSKDAYKYLEIRDRLKVLEANEYIYQFENHESVKVKIETRLQGFCQEEEIKTKESEACNKDYEAKQIEFHNIDMHISKLRDRRTDIAVRAENIKGQGLTLQERIRNLQEQKQECLTRLSQSEKALEEKNAELKSANEHYNMTLEEKKDADKRYAACNNDYLALVNEILDRDQKIKSANQELINAVQQEGENKVDMGKLTTQREFILTRIAELNEEIAVCDEAIKSLEEVKREHEKTLVNKKNDLNRLAMNRNEVSSELRSLREELDKARSRQSDINALMSSCRQRIETFKNFKKEYGAFNSAVKSLLSDCERNKELNSKVLGVVVDLVSVPKEYETAIEMAIGANLQNIVVEDEEDAKYVINYLKEKQYGRLTFLPLTSYKTRELERELTGILREKGCLGLANQLIKYDRKYYNIFSGLLGKTIIADNLDNATAMARKYRYAVKIVTLQGDVLNTSGSISGGSKKSSGTKALSYDRLIQENEEQLKKLLEEKNRIEKKLSSDEDDIADFEEQLAGYDDDIKNSQILVATENGKLDKVVANIDDNVKNINEKISNKGEFQTQLEAIDNALSILGEKGKDVNALKESVDTLAVRTREEYDQKTQLKDQLGEKLSNLRVECNTLSNNLDNYAETIDRLKNEISTLDEEKTLRRDNLANLQDIIQKLTSDRNVELPDKYQKQLEEISRQITEADKYKVKLNDAITELIRKKDDYSKTLMYLNENKIKCQNELDKIEENMLALQNRIKEEYNLDYESALPLRMEEFNYQECRTEIRRLQKEQREMGHVNILSIDNFKEVDGQYQTYSEQIDDIEHTMEGLRKSIADLSKQMLEQFNSEFAKINKNFEIIFKELFGGGKGQLVILPPEEGQSQLDAGIEILAEPPGKKLQSITLMSGGEMALTAIAILFAILRLKAMPFCVLDEIEAALDDANVGLFAQYLKRFSDETQFIVITHRKPTMELADRLYGVTMQEKGVSKVVAVNLSDAVKSADSDKQ